VGQKSSLTITQSGVLWQAETLKRQIVIEGSMSISALLVPASRNIIILFNINIVPWWSRDRTGMLS